MSELPIEPLLPRILHELEQRGTLVLQAPPGAGKTTRVPLVLRDEPWAGGRILVLEPRRIAARAAADRMAGTLGERVGDTVGLRVRFGSKVSQRTRIEVVSRAVQKHPAVTRAIALRSGPTSESSDRNRTSACWTCAV